MKIKKQLIKICGTWARWRWLNRRIPLISSNSNTNLAVIHRQKCLFESFGIKVGACKNPRGAWDSKGPFCILSPDGRPSPTVVLTINLEIAPSPVRVSYNPIWPWFCHQKDLPRDKGGVSFTDTLSNRSNNLDSYCISCRSLWTSIPSELWLESRPAHPGNQARNLCLCPQRQACRPQSHLWALKKP